MPKQTFSQRVLNLTDLSFVLQNPQTWPLISSSEKIKKIKQQAYGYLGIIPGSLLINLVLQKTLLPRFGIRGGKAFLFDCLWYMSFMGITLTGLEDLGRNKDIQELKRKLIENNNSKYLNLLNENAKYLKMELEEQLKSYNYKESDIILIKHNIMKAVEMLKNNSRE